MMREMGSGAEALDFWEAVTARLKSCPFTKPIRKSALIRNA